MCTKIGMACTYEGMQASVIVVVHVRGVCVLESSSLCNSIVHEHVSGYICVSSERFGLLHECLYTLMCWFKIEDAS